METINPICTNNIAVLVTAKEPFRQFYFFAPSVDAAVSYVKGGIYKDITGKELTMLPNNLGDDVDLGPCVPIKTLTKRDNTLTQGYHFAPSLEDTINYLKYYGGDVEVKAEPVPIDQVPRTPSYVTMSSTLKWDKLDHAVNWAKKLALPAIEESDKKLQEWNQQDNKEKQPPKWVIYHPQVSYAVCSFEIIN